MKRTLAALAALGLGTFAALALDGPTPVRDFSPTGLQIDLRKDNTLKVTGVLPGSSAEGKFSVGQTIQRINGKSLPEGFWEHRHFLGDLITQAEAGDGKLRKALKPGPNVIAATSFRQYFKGPDGDLEVYLEALKDLPKPN